VSIERMCAGKEFQVEVASNTGWSGKEICIGRTQISGWKIVRNEFRQVERLRCMKCFPGGETVCMQYDDQRVTSVNCDECSMS